jgi:hyperosmotically inducible protein
MKRKLLAILVTAMFAAPAAYAQGTTAPKDTTKDTTKAPAASGSASTSTKGEAGMKGGTATGSASTSSKGDAMKSDKGTAASAKGQAKADAKKGDGKSPDPVITSKIKTGFIKDKIVRSRNYNVDTKDGVVTVKGKARTQAELDRALEIAKKTEGVKDVKSEVQLMAAADTKSTGSKAKSDKSAAPATTSPGSKPATGSTPGSKPASGAAK